MMATLWALRGLPASGKTTWSRKAVKQLGFRGHRVNRDDLRAMMDESIYSPEREYNINSAEDSLILMMLSRGYDVIVDDTNIKKHRLETLQRLAGTFDSGFWIVQFDESIAACVYRDSLRSSSVGKDVINQMAVEMYAPLTVELSHYLLTPQSIHYVDAGRIFEDI